MTITISVALILGVVVALLLRFKAVGVGVALLVALFGFYLAGTDAAASIRQFVTAVAGAFAGLSN